MTKKESGSASIEATLVFLIFVIAFFVVNNIIISIQGQSVIRKALNQTAQEIIVLRDIGSQVGLKIDGNGNKFDLSDVFPDFNQYVSAFIKGTVNKKIYMELSKILLEKNIKNQNRDLKSLNITDEIKLDFSESSYFDKDGELRLILKYKENLDGFRFFNLSKDVKLMVRARAWIKGASIDIDNESIWQSSNFVRGKFFANLSKNNSKAIILKEGQGIDLFDEDKRELIQVFSLNVFSKSFINMDNTIKEEFSKKLEGYFRQIIKNAEKLGGKASTQDGNQIDVRGAKVKMLIIMPEEARDLQGLEEIRIGIEAIYGLVDFHYMEKALND